MYSLAWVLLGLRVLSFGASLFMPLRKNREDEKMWHRGLGMLFDILFGGFIVWVLVHR